MPPPPKSALYSAADAGYMRRALTLARRTGARCRPNPMVGAVIVKNGRVVGQGAHQRAGGPHAEIEALGSAGAQAAGATMYVTLEPCNHYGRTPPCTESIIAAGITKVVAATADPNRRVYGGGAERLRAEGIEVVEGVLADEAQTLNAAWRYWLEHHRPLVAVSIALSLDSRRDGADGAPASPGGRRLRRALRHQLGTSIRSLADLRGNVPAPGNGAPGASLIVLEREIDASGAALLYRLLQNFRPEELLVAAVDAPADCWQALEAQGAATFQLEETEKGLSLLPFLRYLGSQEIQGIVLGDGHAQLQSFLAEGLVDALLVERSGKLRGTTGTLLLDDPFKTQAIPQLRLQWAKRSLSSVISFYRVGQGLECFDGAQNSSAV